MSVDPFSEHTTEPSGRTTSWLRLAAPAVSTTLIRQRCPAVGVVPVAVDLDGLVDRCRRPVGSVGEVRAAGRGVQPLDEDVRVAGRSAGARPVAHHDRVIATRGERAVELVSKRDRAHRLAVLGDHLGQRVPGAAGHDDSDPYAVTALSGDLHARDRSSQGHVHLTGVGEVQRRASGWRWELLDDDAVVAAVQPVVVLDEHPEVAIRVEQADRVRAAVERAHHGAVWADHVVVEARCPPVSTTRIRQRCPAVALCLKQSSSTGLLIVPALPSGRTRRSRTHGVVQLLDVERSRAGGRPRARTVAEDDRVAAASGERAVELVGERHRAHGRAVGRYHVCERVPGPGRHDESDTDPVAGGATELRAGDRARVGDLQRRRSPDVGRDRTRPGSGTSRARSGRRPRPSRCRPRPARGTRRWRRGGRSCRCCR